ncbi:PAS domain-containing protein [Hymenobacter lucidus]|uniref:histidine kinase n=1 Tax=Hymenobacter lucidus TaxID=2880930 RepID=A0ABS8AL03_9BACT|nr:PAS domain-containing protein [Hymenobacter lucidus]MCB2406829.1 PAS domain-containing protein [Hymenobacter lucidus]
MPAEAVDFQLIFDSLPTPNLLLSPGLVVEAVNEAMCRVLRRPAAELEGQELLTILPASAAGPEATASLWRAALLDVLARQTVRTLDIQRYDLPRANGTISTRYWQATLRPIVQAGQLRHLVCRVLDVTEQVTLQAQGSFSQESFSLLTQATHDAIWDADLRTGQVWRNEMFTTLFGYPGGISADSTLWLEHLHPDDRAAVEAGREAVFASTASVINDQYRFQRADGSWAEVVDRAYVVRGADGQAVRLLGAMQDVTTQRQAERVLQQSNARFSRLLEALPQMAWTSHPGGGVTYYNQRWYDFTGGTFAELQDWGWERFIHPDDLPITITRWQEAIRQGTPFETEHRWRNRQGDYRWFLARAEAVTDETGAILLWVGSNTDIHDGRQLREQLLEKDRLLHRILGQVPADIATLLGPDHTIGFVNEGMQRLYGSRAVPGRPIAEAFPEVADQGFVAIMDQVYTTGQPHYGIEQLTLIENEQTGQPETHYLDFTYQPLLDETGRIQGLLVFAVEATERVLTRRRAQALDEAVRQREKEFTLLADAMPQLAWMAGPDGRIFWYNQRWHEYTGISLAAMADWDWTTMQHPDYIAGVQESWAIALAASQPWTYTFPLRGQDGEYRWFLSRAEPILNEQGEVVRWFGTNTDVTEAQRVQQQLKQQNHELRRINEDLDSFVYTASHDLKQPINNMAGIFEELTRTAYFRDPDAMKLITMFERALQQIYDTIYNLSELVQVQKLRHELPTEPVLLENLTREVLSSMGEQLANVRAIVTTDFAAAPLVVFVRPNLQSVLYNLISNALKYAAPKRTPRIHIWSSQEDGHIVIGVRDNGLGIDLERFGGQLFQLFRRFHDHVSGSGMGLYLVNRIVQSYGGRVEVVSELGQGSTFRIHIPLAGHSLDAAPSEEQIYSI